MKEAIIEKGFWYGNEYLISDDDLKPLHKFEEFHQMVQLCKEKRRVRKKKKKRNIGTVIKKI